MLKQKIISEKRNINAQQMNSIPSDSPTFRYPDGSIRAKPASLDETKKYIDNNTVEFPPGVADLRGRSHVQRTAPNAENKMFEVPPARHEVVYRDLTKP